MEITASWAIMHDADGGLCDPLNEQEALFYDGIRIVMRVILISASPCLSRLRRPQRSAPLHQLTWASECEHRIVECSVTRRTQFCDDMATAVFLQSSSQ